jgi:hypothetical protein
MKVAPHASLGALEVVVDRLDTFDTVLEYKWKPATDPLFGASFYEVRLGDPITVKGNKPSIVVNISVRVNQMSFRNN